jgi:hypothetical protein
MNQHTRATADGLRKNPPLGDIPPGEPHNISRLPFGLFLGMEINSHKAMRQRLAAGTVLLGALTGCVGYVDGPQQGDVYAQPPAVQVDAGVVVQDDYVYYPGYQVYYNSYRRQYAYQEEGVWVSRPAPRGVSVDVLLASPSVRMTFHDSPANHHAAIARQYPKHWAAAGAKHGNPEDRRDGNRDAH